MITLYGKLVAKQVEYGGYVTFVFYNEHADSLYTQYITCTMYPNWDCGTVELNRFGYLTLEDHVAGKDSWFDGESQVTYKYDHIQFIKFIPEPEKTIDNKITL